MAKKKQQGPKRPKGITDEFITEMEAASNDEKKAKIVALQKQLDETQEFLKTNEDIVQLKQKLSLAEGPAREAATVLKNRTKFLIDELSKSGAF